MATQTIFARPKVSLLLGFAFQMTASLFTFDGRPYKFGGVALWAVVVGVVLVLASRRPRLVGIAICLTILQASTFKPEIFAQVAGGALTLLSTLVYVLYWTANAPRKRPRAKKNPIVLGIAGAWLGYLLFTVGGAIFDPAQRELTVPDGKWIPFILGGVVVAAAPFGAVALARCLLANRNKTRQAQ